MSFRLGDKVRYKSSGPLQGKEGTVTDVLNTLFVEVTCDDDSYYWHQANLELIDDSDDWDPDFGYWDRNYSFPFMGEDNKEDKCTCSSWELFHFGCKCGFVEREKEREAERRARGSDLDREDKI